MTDALDDLLTPERIADPYPHFARLREEHPVRYNELYRAWFVHTFEDVKAALIAPEFSSDRVRPIYEERLSPEERERRRPTFEVLQHWLVFEDPPDHTRLRSLVSRAFTPKAVAQLRGRITEIVDEVIEEIAPKGQIDLIHDFASPIPAIVIAEMMGVPTEDRHLFKAWSDELMQLVFGAEGVADRRERAQQGLIELVAYLRDLIARFRAHPEDNLITALIQAKEENDSLSEEEIVGTCTLLLFGGHETTTNLIGNGIRCLLDHPDQLDRLRQDPSLMPTAIEELLRFDGPSKMQVRRVAADVELHGQQLREGQQVYLVQAAANRDPAEFPDPDRLDLGRTPNRHIGFGFGIHYCLGAPIARLEGSIAIDALLHKLPNLRRAETPEVWHPTLISRGMRSFTVEFDTP